MRVSLKQETCDMPEYHNNFMVLKTFNILEIHQVLKQIRNCGSYSRKCKFHKSFDMIWICNDQS